ncbi:MAG TPA: hypothetical protein VFO08_07970 [Methylomirabilota bacterium]|nr:hypothetical protein [Methylomirabilota bacterium]
MSRASLAFRSGLRERESQRFLASCWVIVEAPRGSSWSRRASSSAFCISSRAKPWCEKKLTSSDTSTARFSAGEMAA